jgi:hypothetical protein
MILIPFEKYERLMTRQPEMAKEVDKDHRKETNISIGVGRPPGILDSKVKSKKLNQSVLRKKWINL